MPCGSSSTGRANPTSTGSASDAVARTSGPPPAIGGRAAVYGVDPAATRYSVADDEVDRLRSAYLHDRRLVPVPDPALYEGPRTRRAFFAHLAREEHERELARARRFRKS